MVYPIVRYGHEILRNRTKEISNNYPHLSEIISNMWQTLYATKGVGLAAPQINLSIRLFMIDSVQMFEGDDKMKEDYPDFPGHKLVFINPKITKSSGELWAYEEGCLSIPHIKTNIERPQSLTIEYLDENFIPQTQHFTGISARIIFHEYDHLEGKLFIDKLSVLKKKIFASRLNDILKGKVKTFYRLI